MTEKSEEVSIPDDETDELIGLDKANQIKFRCCCCGVSEKYYMLGLFTICNFFLFADQNLLAPNLTLIGEEFGFEDDEIDLYLGGYISLGFFAFGGVVSMVVGLLADQMNRKYVFAITVLIGEFSCFMTYFVPTNSRADFWYGLWLTRAVTGVSLGGALPLQFSILGDLFDEKARGKAIAAFSIANGVGLAFGQSLANFMRPDFRTPFLIVSIPAFLIVALYVLTTTEPKRGQAELLVQDNTEALEQDHKISCTKVKKMFSIPTICLTILQGLPGTLPWGVAQIFLNDFLLEDKDKSEGTAAFVLLLFGLAAGGSTLVGGFLVDRYIQKAPHYLPIIAAVSTFIAPFSLIAVLRTNSLSKESAGLGFLMFSSGLSAGLAGIIMKGILLHVALPETRGTAFAFQSLLDDLGRGVGPFIISVIIRFSSTREDGLVYGVLGWYPTSVIMFLVYFFVRKDIQKSREVLKDLYGIEDVTDENEGESKKATLAESHIIAQDVNEEDTVEDKTPASLVSL